MAGRWALSIVAGAGAALLAVTRCCAPRCRPPVHHGACVRLQRRASAGGMPASARGAPAEAMPRSLHPPAERATDGAAPCASVHDPNADLGAHCAGASALPADPPAPTRIPGGQRHGTGPAKPGVAALAGYLGRTAARQGCCCCSSAAPVLYAFFYPRPTPTRRSPVCRVAVVDLDGSGLSARSRALRRPAHRGGMITGSEQVGRWSSVARRDRWDMWSSAQLRATPRAAGEPWSVSKPMAPALLNTAVQYGFAEAVARCRPGSRSASCRQGQIRWHRRVVCPVNSADGRAVQPDRKVMAATWCQRSHCWSCNPTLLCGVAMLWCGNLGRKDWLCAAAPLAGRAPAGGFCAVGWLSACSASAVLRLPGGPTCRAPWRMLLCHVPASSLLPGLPFPAPRARCRCCMCGAFATGSRRLFPRPARRHCLMCS